MTSEAQRNANRSNALRSTGPRSDEGKLRSSQNATKHGGYATRDLAIQVGVFKEDPDEIEGFVEALISALSPRDALEQQEAHGIAMIYLRLRRINWFESQAMSEPQYPHSPTYESDLIIGGFESFDQFHQLSRQSQRGGTATRFLNQALTNAVQVEARNSAVLDRALKRYQLLQTRDLDHVPTTPGPTLTAIPTR